MDSYQIHLLPVGVLSKSNISHLFVKSLIIRFRQHELKMIKAMMTTRAVSSHSLRFCMEKKKSSIARELSLKALKLANFGAKMPTDW